MSAAATAAGYLYASGRLRGKAKDGEGEGASAQPERRRLRIAALPPTEPANEVSAAPRPKRVPRVEYRVRRWKPE